MTMSLTTSISAGSSHAGQAELRLRCPRCSANLCAPDCLKCGFALCKYDGIVDALPPVRGEHYAQFIEDYERIRVAEGRGSCRAEFYLALPFRDVSGRNSDQWRIRARTYGYLMKHILAPALPARASILDLGAGNCWMSFRLALAGYNAGEARVEQAIHRRGLREFDMLLGFLPPETRRYVPAVMLGVPAEATNQANPSRPGARVRAACSLNLLESTGVCDMKVRIKATVTARA